MSEIIGLIKEKDLEIDQLMKKFESSFKNLKPQIAEAKKKYFRDFLQKLKPKDRQKAQDMTWEHIHEEFCKNRNVCTFLGIEYIKGEQGRTILRKWNTKCGCCLICEKQDRYMKLSRHPRYSGHSRYPF